MGVPCALCACYYRFIVNIFVVTVAVAVVVVGAATPASISHNIPRDKT